jgi:hypothetical protein
MLSIVNKSCMLIAIMLTVIMLSVHYAECRGTTFETCFFGLKKNLCCLRVSKTKTISYNLRFKVSQFFLKFKNMLLHGFEKNTSQVLILKMKKKTD